MSNKLYVNHNAVCEPVQLTSEALNFDIQASVSYIRV